MVPVVLCDFWRLWIGKFLDESGADDRRLVKCSTTLWTAVTGDLDFSIRVRSVAPFRVVSGLSAGRATVSTWLFVVLVPAGRGRLWLIGLFLARRCVRPLVPSDLGSEPLVLLTEFLILLLELLVLLLKFINAVFKSSDSLEQLLHFFISDHHNSPWLVQTTRDGLSAGDRPSENTLSSAFLYSEVRSNLRESGEIVLGVNTYVNAKLFGASVLENEVARVTVGESQKALVVCDNVNAC